MNALAEWLDFVVSTLQRWPLCRAVRVVETQQFSERQFALKVRAELETGDPFVDLPSVLNYLERQERG
ncbi:MAG: hypothetical protein HY784_05060 [Chloroflexi bacterium]|nr:hypothetical protein [Chloroflexota bacterium]